MKTVHSIVFLSILITIKLSAQWNNENFPQSTYYLACVYFLDENYGWISGGSNSEGNIYSTTDGGSTWTKTTFPGTEELESIFFIDELNGWAVGDKGVIVHTTNGGEEWVYQNSGTDSYLSSVFFVDENKGWITYSTSAGDPPTDYVGYLLYTSDGGNNWSIQKEVEDYSFKDVFFIDENYGWVACYNFSSLSDIFLTTNGGASWETRDLNTRWAFFYEVHFIDQNTGWLVGESGSILKSTNGGNNWLVQHEYEVDNLYSCFAVDESKVYAVGRRGKILYTSNSGDNWVQQSSGTTQSLNSIFFTNENIGWIVGFNSTCLSTENGGVTGIEIESDLPDIK